MPDLRCFAALPIRFHRVESVSRMAITDHLKVQRLLADEDAARP
jgi:hypothetical protein